METRTPVAMMVMRLLASLLKMLEVSLRLSTLRSRFLNCSCDWKSSSLLPMPPRRNLAWLRNSDTTRAMIQGSSLLASSQAVTSSTNTQASNILAAG